MFPSPSTLPCPCFRKPRKYILKALLVEFKRFLCIRQFLLGRQIDDSQVQDIRCQDFLGWIHQQTDRASDLDLLLGFRFQLTICTLLLEM